VSGPIQFSEVRWRPLDSEDVWEIRRLNDNQKSVFIDGTDRGVEYVIEVRNIGPTGLSSNWVSAIHTPVLLNRPLTPLIIDDITGEVVVDCKVEEQFSLLLSRDVTAVSFVNVPEEKIIIIVVIQGGQFGIAWPGSVVFESGELYVPTQVLGRADTIGLATVSGGAEWLLRTSVDVDPNGDGTVDGGGSPELPPGVDPIEVQADPIQAECVVSGGVACVPSVQAVVTIVGGTPPYTISWSRIVGGELSQIDNAEIQSPTFSLVNGLTKEDDESTWRATVVDSTGVLVFKNLQVRLIRTTTDMVVSGNPNVFGFCITSPPGVCVPSGTPLISVSGGSPPYTFLWTFVSGSSSVHISNPSVINPLFSVSAGRFQGIWIATWNLRITDSVGDTKDVSSTITMNRESSQ